MPGFLWTVFAVALHLFPSVVVPLCAQGTRKDDIVVNSRGVPLAGATVRVCATPASGQPCTPLANIFSDSALTQALTNPTTTDGLGNYFFYAAPGRYLIEISGPGITTRQIPDVVLPSDPTAPAFSSVSSSGNISAFSLSLTGNLTVNGNTTVLGSLAGGTLNLTNQGTGPGAASTGTVNLYTKADKRLYYKDDTGAEIGPVANTTGAQTNVTNTFTAAQNFDADVHSKGPNPHLDLARYGAYSVSGTPPSTTGSINSGSTTLTLASAIDFANGQGIVVYKAGASTALTTPTAGSVTPGGVTNGVTSHSYAVFAEDYFGGLTASAAVGSTTTSPATLGINTIPLASASRSSGVATYTCSANCNVEAGRTVYITGFSGVASAFFNRFNGTKVITSTPTSTTFTTNDFNLPDESDSSGTPQAQIMAFNKVSWGPGGGAPQTGVLRYWICRDNVLVGVTPGIDPVWFDEGKDLQTSVLPGYIPTACPVSAQPGFLATTIVSGGGTNTLTLADAATTTVTSQSVLHDNSKPLVNAINAALATGTGIVFIPFGPNPYVFNATTVLPGFTSGKEVLIRLGAAVTLNNPWVLANHYAIEGGPGFSSAAAQLYTHAQKIDGNAYPLFFAPGTASSIHLEKLYLRPGQKQQNGVWADVQTNGSGVTGWTIDDCAFDGNPNTGSPVVFKGGFDMWFRRGVFNVGGSGSTGLNPPGLRLTGGSPAVCNTNCTLPGLVRMEYTYFDVTGVQLDNLYSPGIAAAGSTGDYLFHNVTTESLYTPFFRVNAGPSFLINFRIFQSVGADQASSLGTPYVDTTGSTNINQMRIHDTVLTNSSQVLITADNAKLPGTDIVNSGGVIGLNHYRLSSAPILANPELFGSSLFSAQLTKGVRNPFTVEGSGNFMGAAIITPQTAPSLAASAGGAVPVGTHTYSCAAVGWNNGESAPGPTASITVSSGAQTVTVTCPALPTGAKGYNVQRDGARAHAVSTNPITTTNVYVDTFGFTDGFSSSQGNYSASSYLNSAEAGAPAVRVNGELMSAAPRGVHNVFFPGVLNSAWTGATLTLDKAITVTRVQVQAKTAPAGCATNAVVRLSDGATNQDVTIAAAANDSGAITKNYPAGAALTVAVQTAASGCTTAPADANVVVQYRMQ
jgi:hypothetical protein